MRMRKGFRRVISLAAAGIMAVSLFTVSGTINTGKAANKLDYDAVSTVNYSTMLGRAVDYGILAKEYEQANHTETNFAVKTFTKYTDINNDPDLAGDQPLSFIIGEVVGGNKIRLGKTYTPDGGSQQPMKFNIETTQAVKDMGCTVDSGAPAEIVWKISSQESINNNVDSMIKNIQENSNSLYSKATSFDIKTYESNNPANVDLNHYTLDLSDAKYKNSVVYISIPSDSKFRELYKSDGTFMDSLNIKKYSSTEIVFNISDTEVHLNKFLVTVVDKSNKEIHSDTNNGNSTAHNDDVDEEIAQKVIWNLNKATTITLNTVAGAFIIPNASANTDIKGSSAGWLATAGKVINSSAEWHYIYKKRGEDLNKDTQGQMHFAARKAYTHSFNDNPLIEDTTIYNAENEYSFDFYETGSDFNISGKTPQTVSNNAKNKIKFPVLTFTDAGVHYYVIKEKNPGTVKDKIKNSDGEIDIKLTVKKDGDKVSFVVSSWKYLTASDKQDGKVYATNDEIAMTGVEFTLGGIYNKVMDNTGAIKVTKAVTGVPASASGKEYTFTVKNKAGKWIKADGSESATEVKHTIKAGETKLFDGLPLDTYTVTEDEASAAIANCTLSDTGVYSGTATLAADGDTKTVALNNVYVKDTGSLKITKKLDVSEAKGITAPSSYQFAVKNEEGKYVTDINGTIGTTAVVYLPAVSKDGSVTISNLPVGKYTVEEKDSRVPEYTLEVKGLQEVNVAKGTIATVDVTNKYITPKKAAGELHVKKVMDSGSDTLPAGKTFPIKISFDKAGSYAVNVNGAGSKMISFTANTAEVFDLSANGTIDITDIPLGTTYKVEEAISAEDIAAGYSKVGITDNYNKKIETDKQKEDVVVTNKYVKPKKGRLELIKTIKGELTKEEREGKLRFTITGPDGYNKTFKISETDAEGLKLQADGTYKLILNDLKVGTYNVTETTEDITGKTVTVKYSIGTDKLQMGKAAAAEVGDGKTTTVNFENIYAVKDAKGKLNIRKIFEGEALTAEQKANISFTVSKDGNVIKTIKFSELNTTGAYLIDDIPVGTYVVTETGCDVTGKKLTITNTVTVDGIDTNGTGDKVTVDVLPNEQSGVKLINKYEEDKSEEATTTQEGSSEQVTTGQQTASEQVTTGQQATTGQQTASEQATESTTSTQQTTTSEVSVTTEKKTVTTKKKTTTESDDDEDDEDDEEDNGKGNLLITIFDEKTGSVVPGAKIVVTKPNGNTSKYTTNNVGQVSIKKAAVGDYTVTVTEVPKGYTVTKNAEVDVEVVKNKTTVAEVRIDKEGEVSVTSKTTQSATKTGDSVPVIPLAAAFLLAVVGLIVLFVKRQEI